MKGIKISMEFLNFRNLENSYLNNFRFISENMKRLVWEVNKDYEVIEILFRMKKIISDIEKGKNW